MKKLLLLFTFVLTASLTSCSGDDDMVIITVTPPQPTLKYLALGDSYTIGQSICNTCRFPEQLKDSLAVNLNREVAVDVVARTGWTTGNLLAAIAADTPTNDYDLVTLLIGVNNQYQNSSFSNYEAEFPQLVERAIIFAKGDVNNLIVVSIPDYAFTPFGQGSSNSANISAQIDAYNMFAKNYCLSRDIKFVDITPITRRGLQQPDLVASDGLHPSKIAYTEFVALLLPIALQMVQ